MGRATATVLAILMAAFGASEASAQSAASVKSSRPGGVKLGEKSRLHAKLDLSTLLDYNAFREADDEAEENWRLLVRPGLRLDVPGPQFSFNAAADLTLTQFLNDLAGNRDETQVGGSVGLGLEAGSDRSAVAFSLEDRLIRTPVFLAEPETVAADEIRFQQWQNVGEARVTVRPGGRALELDFGYENQLSIFEELPDSHQHLGLFDIKWKFLPKTALLFTSKFGVFVNEAGQDAPDATPLNIQTGLIGQLTPRFLVELRVGYGNSLVWTNDDLFGTQTAGSQDSPTGAARITYRPSNQASVTLGYERSVRPLILFDSVIEDAIQLRSQLGIDRFVAQLFTSFSFRNFGDTSGDSTDPNVAPDDSRNAQLLTGGVSLDYYVLRYLLVGAQYRIFWQDADDSEAGTSPGEIFIGDFTRHQVAFTVGVTY